MESHSGDQFDRLLSLYPTRRSHEVRARHGSIINISAGSGERSSRGGPAYALTKQAAADLAPMVRANGLISGLVGTPIGSKEMGSRKPKYDMIPLRRMGQLDVAEAALFLASDKASYITNSILPVDGSG
jgi:3-oxoacyl-[acyl-carrier protein] reductase